MLNVINPTTEEIIADYSLQSPIQVEQTLIDTSDAFKIWSQKTLSERSKPMAVLSQLLNEHVEKYSRLITQEMGKPIVEARSEIKKCAQVCSYFAAHAQNFLKEETFSDDKLTCTVSFEPLGIILGIMPWNFPFWQVFRFLAPTLMAGNGVIVKHALNVPGCALAIEEVIKQAGFPQNIVRNIFLDNSEVYKVIEHPLIKGVSLTGSDKAGESVASAAGNKLKKCVLELGGSDPYIVLENADLHTCIKTAVKARLINGGQSCIAAKRFIVVHSQIDEFCQQLLEELKLVKIGDPMDEKTTLGPLAREDLFKKFNRQIQDSIERGARLLIGGEPLKRTGFFYPPTVLLSVTPGMPAFDEETFGPLFAIIEAKDAQHALELANNSVYGLGSSLWTQDLDLAKELASKIQAGLVFINGMTVSDPRFPFGGVKRSGFGRELGQQGIKEFVNIKTIVIAKE